MTPEQLYRTAQKMHGVMGSECEHCGSSWDYDFQPNVEAFDMCGQTVCDECAEAVFEDNGQFGVGA